MHANFNVTVHVQLYICMDNVHVQCTMYVHCIYIVQCTCIYMYLLCTCTCMCVLVCSLYSADLLGLNFDTPVSMPTDKQTTTQTTIHPQLQHTMQVMEPQISSDISLLEPTPTNTLLEITEPEGSLALNLLETPLTSLRVPEEYSHHPIVAGWENKVQCCKPAIFSPYYVSGCTYN